MVTHYYYYYYYYYYIANYINSMVQCLLHNLIATQLVQEFPAFYETRMFITVIKTARPWSLS